MALTSLYKGYIGGRITALKLGPNNPAIDTSSTEQDARAKLRAHVTKGVKRQPSLSAVRRPVKRQPGTRVSGATRVKGGVV